MRQATSPSKALATNDPERATGGRGAGGANPWSFREIVTLPSTCDAAIGGSGHKHASPCVMRWFSER